MFHTKSIIKNKKGNLLMQHLYPRPLCQHSTWLKHQTVNQQEPKLFIQTEYLIRILDVSLFVIIATRTVEKIFFFSLQMHFSCRYRHKAWQMGMRRCHTQLIPAFNLIQVLVSLKHFSSSLLLRHNCVFSFLKWLLDFLRRKLFLL